MILYNVSMFLNPALVTDKFDIRPGMKTADFGCGSGHFTVEMAKRVGNNGRVYAFDVQKEVVEALKSKIKLNSFSTVEIARVDLEKENATGLKDGLLDFVLLSNILFQAEDKGAIAKEAHRVLKSGGGVGMVEWSFDIGQDKKLGPPKEMRIAKDSVKGIFTKAGFSFEKEFDAGDDHYGLIFRK